MLQNLSLAYLYGLDPMVGFTLVVVNVQVQTSWVKGSLVTSDSSVADRSGPSDAGTVVAVAGDGTVQTGLGTVLRIQYPQNILIREKKSNNFLNTIFLKGTQAKLQFL